MKTKIILTLAVVSLLFSSVYATTSISGGNVSGTWTLSGSPYYIYGDITVPNGNTLTIEAGVEVFFTKLYKFEVLGRVLAIGTPSNYIWIKGSSKYGFKGIRFNSTPATNDTSRFSYCYIIFGKAITGTSEEQQGGAFFFKNFSKVVVQNCIISNNYAVGNGGAVYVGYELSPVFSNNVFCNNQTDAYGGAIYIYKYSTPVMIGNTFANNYASSRGGAIYSYAYDDFIITNCIVYGNRAGYSDHNIYPDNRAGVSYSDVEGGYSGEGNIDEYPFFNSPTSTTGIGEPGYSADWSMTDKSSCIDAGNNNNSLGWIPAYDLAGNCRTDYGVVDMGAYEFIKSTIVSGAIATKTTWNGYVVVKGSITVNDGVELIIGKGTKVLFDGNYQFNVIGRVIAEGTSKSPIQFDVYNKSQTWNGLIFSGTLSKDTSYFQYCVFRHAQGLWGALFIDNYSCIVIENCIFANNYATKNGGAIYAVGLNGTGRIVNNLIVNNTSDGHGGGMYLSSCSGMIANNTLTCNYAKNYGGGIYASGVPNIKNCIFYNNKSINYSTYNNVYAAGTTALNYCCFLNGFSGGTGNISSDPKFKNPTTGYGKDYAIDGYDFSLQSGSPCVDKGNLTSIALPKYDLNNKIRIYNSIVDIGAYEDKSVMVVCGWITGNVIWDATTIKINCNVTIDKTATVTILPGTVVEFQNNYYLRVRGSLIANGTAQDSIKFTARNHVLGWGGIRFDSVSYAVQSQFSHCIFEYAYRKVETGVLYWDGGGAITIYNYSNLAFKNCRFSDNKVDSATNNGSLYSSSNKGAAIYMMSTNSVLIENCNFYRNYSSYDGGCIHVWLGNCILNNNRFISNYARNGGALKLVYSFILANNNLFANNYVTHYGAVVNDGGYTLSGNSVYKNNCIVNNEGGYGGAFYFTTDKKPEFYNNTIANNLATKEGGAFYLSNNVDAIMRNNIIYGNKLTSTSHQFFLDDISSDPKFYYCNVEGDSSAFTGHGSYDQYQGVYESNINVSPSFKNPTSGAGRSYNGVSADWTLQSGSPCINTGMPDISNLNLPALDMAGNPRIYNGRVDIGAYENQLPVYAQCTISQNTTWDADTIRVNCDVYVNSGVTLTITPGTYVKFMGYYKIDVKGRILAIGTSTERITFSIANNTNFYTTHVDSFAMGGWKGISFDFTSNANDTSKFVFCNIHYAKGDRKTTLSTTSYGGAFYMYNFSKVLISNCNISNNLAGYYGGAIYLESSSPVIMNNIFANNSVLTTGSNYGYGGAIYLDDSDPKIINNTIVNNKSSNNGGGIYIWSSSPLMANNIIYGNVAINYVPNCGIAGSSAPAFYNNNIEGGYSNINGNNMIAVYSNNIAISSEFLSPSTASGARYDGINANWGIKQNSPCINTGSGSVYYSSNKDYYGEIRVIADTVDIGAYECQISYKFLNLNPVSKSFCLSSPGSFSANANILVAYQWQKNGTILSGANSSTLLISSVSTADTGYYSCIMSNAFGSITSSSAYLSLLLPPTITSQPSALSKCLSESATFSITASGSNPLNYQWYNTNGLISGATNNTFTINSVGLNDQSSYYCVVTNNCGFYTSNGASLTLKTAPDISTLSPTNSICETTNITYAVTTTGSPIITYQWFKNGSAVSGATSSSYTISNANTSHAGNYYCKATNSCGSDSTNITSLTINTKPDIPSQSASTTVCSGQSVTLSITTSGTQPITYQWYKASSPISGATNNSYTISSTSSSDSTSYYCIATNTCGTKTSTTAFLTVNQPPKITSQSGSTSVCKGSSANFSVTASGTSPLSYQWYFNNNKISGATTANYTISSTNSGSAGNYYCIVSNSCGNATTSTYNLIINDKPVINAQTVNTTICAGQTMVMSVTASGSGTLTYQWYKNSSVISGATNSSYTITSAGSGDSTSYYCAVTNSCGTTNSNVLFLTVNQPPKITAQTGVNSVCSGSSAGYTVTATGSATLTYQWYKNTTAISGQTTSSYNTGATTSASAGNYYCIVTNGCNKATSTAYTLTINEKPGITAQTGNTTICAGQTMVFSVTASGSGTLTYQWYKNAVILTGATNSSYVITSVGSTDSASYYCIVTNSCGTTTSNSIFLTVKQSPKITAQSGGTSVCSGNAANYTVTATGSATLSYQWYKDNTAISGQTGSAYAISSTNSSSAGTYYCAVTNTCGTSSSSAYSLTIKEKPTITAQTGSTSLCAGQNMTFSVTAGGTSPVTYQWYKSTTAVSGATNSTYTINSVSSADSASYYCIATNSCGSATSSTAFLTVLQPPKVKSQSGVTSVCSGSAANFSVTASGSSTLTYQWYKNNTAIPSTNSPNYAISSATTASAGNYHCVVSNSCGNASSTAYSLAVLEKPVITAQTGNTTVCAGQSITISVTATGSATLSYQWYKNATVLSGATGSTYTISTAGSSDSASYYCVVTNSCGTATSSNIFITVKQSPKITSQSGSTSVCSGSGASFSVTTTGSASITYQWYKNSTVIGTATSASYTISGTTSASSGTYYCIATNSCGNATSTSYTLSVSEKPVITSQTGNTTVCAGQSASLSVTSGGTTPLSYQWYKNSSAVSGATSSMYIISAASKNDSASYYCVVSNSCGTATSSSLFLTVNQSPKVVSQSGTSASCIGEAANFSVTATGTATINYQWYLNNSIISGATNNTYAISSVTNTSGGNYYCVVSNSCGSYASTGMTLTVNQKPVIITQTSNTSICSGQSVSISVTATGTSPISYQWYKGGSIISGATASSLVFSSATSSDSATYYCKVKNSCDSIMSSAIVLTVMQPAKVISQTGSSNVCKGQAANFSITASGTQAITYQWYKDNTIISGATNNSYTISTTNLSSAGSYYCTAKNVCGTSTSSTNTLMVSEGPVITTQTNNTSICEGQSMTFSVTASGSNPLTYQWYKNGTSINGAVGNTYVITSIKTTDAGNYSCKVKNSCDSVTTSAIVLTVKTAPVITSQTGSQNICSGSSLTLNVSASGTSTITYQWYKDNTTITGATNNFYLISNANTSSSGNYYCKVTNDCGSINSSTITVGVDLPPAISSLSSGTTICEGSSTTFSVSVTGTPNFSYQWYKGTTKIAGATNAVLVLSSVKVSDAGTYSVKVKNHCDSVTSTGIVLTVNTSPVITAQPTNATICEGSNQSFSVTATGTSPITYQWYKDGKILSGATNNQYNINKATPAEGGFYYCVVSNSCGKMQSNSAILTVNTSPDVITLTPGDTLCEGNNMVFSITSGGTSPITYQWYGNGKAITNATNSFYIISRLMGSDEGSYYCEATNVCGKDQSQNIILKVNSPLSLISESSDSGRCEGEGMTLKVEMTGTQPVTYQWYKGGLAINGATMPEYKISSVTVGDGEYYYCEAENVCGKLKSGKKKLTVNKNPEVNIGEDTVFCKGGSITLTPGSGYICKWNTGSINPELVVSKAGEYYVEVKDGNGCKGTSNTVKVGILEPYEGEEICVVTNDPYSGKNLIAWERTSGKRTAYYKIYRETTASGVYEPIGLLPYDSVSVWVDDNSNPKQRSYRYAISVIDSCGNESGLSSSHKTMHLTINQGVGSTINLIWSHYEGTSFGTYRIYRGTKADSLDLIDSIQSSLNSYTDLNPPKGIVYYQVSMVKPDVCYPEQTRAITTKNTGPFSQSISNMKDYQIGTSKYMELSPLIVEVDSSYGSTGSVNVFTNISEWNISVSQGWLNAEKDLENNQIRLTTLSSNTLGYAREAYVWVSATDMQTKTITVYQLGTSGSSSIGEESEGGVMKVYPNPFKELTYIELPGEERRIELLQVIDMQGRVVREIRNVEGNVYELRRDELSRGMYYVRAYTDKAYTAKIMIE